MTAAPAVLVRLATADEVRPLRMAVLRPDQPLVPADYDERPDTRHVAAFAGGTVVGCASVFPSPYDAEPRAWQLRGMAVAPDLQGSGIGAQVLLGAVDVVRDSRAPLLWANARVTALGFYERLGFEVHGEEYVYGPAALPHKIILMRL
ncbi:MAG TPA: GNAT family N-acetyltransferase [Mycobacteriales bacterium]|nr:GNAT family N-acetyltransferase [Mycobacteriales bacterium]